MVEEGQKAPDFSLMGSDGKEHTLGSFGNGYVILYFYPKDLTPGCTIEAREFNTHLDAIKKLGGTVVGISKDSLELHGKFIESCSLGFTLLSDLDSKTIKKYGAYGSRGIFGEGTLRNTYLIKGDRIVRVFEKVNPRGHADEVIKAIQDLKKEGSEKGE